MQDTFGKKFRARLSALLLVIALPLALNGQSASADNLPKEDSGVAIAHNSSGDLTWQHNYKQALRMASSQDKLLLIDLYTDWCGWCKKLDSDTYTDHDVIAFLNKHFVVAKLNAEDGADGESVAGKFNDRGAYPCTIILDAKGKPKGLFYGYRNPQEYIQSINKFIAGGN